MNDTIAQGQPFELTVPRPSPQSGLLVAAIAIVVERTVVA
jgi:hypothetical protein